MIKDITIGQFFPGKSFIHKMDARMKVCLTLVFIILVFLVKNFYSMALMLVALGVIVGVSRVPIKIIAKGVKPILILIIFTAILNVFYVKKGQPLVDFYFIHITTGGLFTALFMVIRIICLIVSSSMLTYTTSPTMLTDALERLMSPLKVLKIEVHSIAMMMTIALRFIPTLIDEIDRIMNAQKARGADMETGNLSQRVKALIPIFIPLFVSSFRRAYELAFAMECRCYRGGDGRTRMKQMKLKGRDYLALVIIVLVFAGVILLNRFFVAVI
ncbi:MAG: energy-coupling factor transporter transmembrane protein EcfT [Clostridiales bacterium]|nr:energy-coupling factor transporter transmembrane protein EcfT [Clostridiales bacterium]